MFLTAIFEAATGLVLLAFPSLFLDLLLGVKDPQQVALIIARLAGAALVTMSIFCYFVSNFHPDSAQRGIACGLLFYNMAAVALLAYADFGLSLSGLVLWPAVVLHAFLALWCILCITSLSRQK